MSCKSRPRLSSNKEKKIDMSSVIFYPFHNSQQSLTTISNTAIKIFLIFSIIYYFTAWWSFEITHDNPIKMMPAANIDYVLTAFAMLFW